jgi:hypothetical protein
LILQHPVICANANRSALQVRTIGRCSGPKCHVHCQLLCTVRFEKYASVVQCAQSAIWP